MKREIISSLSRLPSLKGRCSTAALYSGSQRNVNIWTSVSKVVTSRHQVLDPICRSTTHIQRTHTISGVRSFSEGGAHQSPSSVVMSMVAAAEKGSEIDLQSLYNAFGVWAKSGHVNADRALSIIMRLDKTQAGKQLTVTIYNPVITSYDMQNEPEKAETFLRWLENRKDDKFHPNQDTYLYLIKAFKNARNPEMCQSILDEFCKKIDEKKIEVSKNESVRQHFNMVLAAWVQSKHPKSLEKATANFDAMQKIGIKPNDITMNAFLGLWIKQDSLDKAQELFQNMAEKGFRPNSSTYNIFMSAWARQRRPDKADDLFQDLKKAYSISKDYTLKPGIAHYTTLLQAWSKVPNPKKTASVLSEWIAAFASGLVKEKPTTQEFSAVIQAWARSNNPDSAKQAELGLRQMFQLWTSNEFDCRPNVATFTSVISAYAKSNEKGSGDRAYQLFQKLTGLAEQYPDDKLLQPDLIVYQKVIWALIESAAAASSKSGDTSSSSKEDKVHSLLVDLQHKPESFWNSNNYVDTDRVLTDLKQKIGYSPFPHKKMLLRDFRQLLAARNLDR
mmetsp:Transcript_1571/g.2226  ORF Transcript_1571/g.2226 Transcript_1571/m.2226 type:complete len:560 (+) Transcript_1571:64-1743(+)